MLSTLRLWRAALARPLVALVLLTTGIGRLARASVPLTVVLVVSRSTGSFAWAGLAAATLTVADAITAPLKGRLADRFGRAALLIPASIVYAAALIAMAIPPASDQVWILGCAVVAGAGFPPISGSVKAILPLLVRDAAPLQAAYVLESTVQQTLFFIGPLYVAAIASVLSAETALYGAAASAVLGVTGFVVITRTVAIPQRARGSRRRFGVLGLPAVLQQTGTTFLHSIMLGTYGVAVTASAAAYGMPNAAGLVLAAGPVGGLVGGLLISATGDRLPRRYLGLLLITAACYAPLPFVPFPVIAVSLFAGGLAVTPIAAICYLLVSRATPETMRTEAFTWVSTAVAAGSALGAALAGLAVDQLGVRAPFALTALAVLAAAVVAWRGRSVLEDGSA